MIIQVFLHPNFLSALFFSFYLIDSPESEKVAEKTNFNKRQINFLLARKQKKDVLPLFREKYVPFSISQIAADHVPTV